MRRAVPAATRAIVGGSGSFAADFPGRLHPEARLLERDMVFVTPWGESPPFSLFELGGRRVLHVRLHGWREGVSRGRASRQVFSVLHRAGVKRILSDAGVGSLNRLLDPGDLVIADDFVDQTTDRDGDGMIVGGHLLIMRDPACATARDALASAGATLRSLVQLVEEMSEEPQGLELGEVGTTTAGSPDLDLPIEDLDLSERPRNCLKRAQVNSVGELLEKTEDDLLAITNFGQKSLDEVIAKLDERGLSLRTKD